MTLTYLYQSGIAIEDGDNVFVFDFFKDPKKLMPKILDNKTNIYFFASHSHFDHFSKKIFDYKASKYILSSDIVCNTKDNIISLSKFDTYKSDDIFVMAFGSTDIGVSFYVEYNGFKMFHAGDLNNWHWNETADTYHVTKYEQNYKNELQDIKSKINYLDLLMFPFDGNLGKDFLKGPIEFCEEIKVKSIFPMHFYDKFNILNEFDEYASKNKINFIKPNDFGFIVEVF